MKYFAVLLTMTSIANAATPRPVPKLTDPVVVVYTEVGSKLNHYYASGYMGDYGDIKMSPRWEKSPAEGKYCIRVQYTAERKQGAGWAGVYWQDPANNWGDKKGGFNLSQYKKVTFMARGEKGGETIDKFGVGGITAQEQDGDTDNNDTGQIELTKDWKKYEIDLTNKDLTHIIGGFLWVMNADLNGNGAVFFLDEIKFEK